LDRLAEGHGTWPFATRTETVLRRAGYFDDPSWFDTLTEADVLGWWNAGPATVADLRFAGNRTIRRHLEEADMRSAMNTDLVTVAAEPWAQRRGRRRRGRYLQANSALSDCRGAAPPISGWVCCVR
jgi:hypothetical protein